MTHHPRTLAVLATFDRMEEAAKALIVALPDAWRMPVSPRRAASEPPLLSVGLLAHHTQRAAVVQLEGHEDVFPPQGTGPWASVHARLVAAAALAQVEQAAQGIEDALRTFPALRAGFSFGVVVPQPTSKTGPFQSDGTLDIQIVIMGRDLTTGFEQLSWSLQRGRLAMLLDLLAPFDYEADALWVVAASSAVADAQNGWHDGRVDLLPSEIEATEPDPVVGAFDNALEPGADGKAWRHVSKRLTSRPHMPMRLVPAASEAQAVALALVGTIARDHLWTMDADKRANLLQSIICVRFQPL